MTSVGASLVESMIMLKEVKVAVYHISRWPLEIDSSTPTANWIGEAQRQELTGIILQRRKIRKPPIVVEHTLGFSGYDFLSTIELSMNTRI